MGRKSFRKEELLLAVLKVLERRPLSEAEVLGELEQVLGGVRPRDVLVALAALEAEGLVRAAPLYEITTEGIEALVRRGQALDRMAFLFTDVVGSTELLDRLGDDAAHQQRRRHFGLLREAIGRHGGREVKSLGDGLMVVFATLRAAVECAVAMQRAVAASDDRLELRVGVASGEVVCEDGDYFGRPVVVARRLCDAAGGGEVLVSERPAGPVAGAEARELPPLRLKGLSEPVAASAVRVARLALVA
jgi:class 3 adenylate cyclase